MSEMMLLKYAFYGFLGIGSATIGLSFLGFKSFARSARFFLISMAVIGVLILDMFIIEPNWIEVKKIKIKDSGLAQILGDTKLVHLADLHLTEGIRFREKELIRKVNQIGADFIFITGDFFDDLSQLEAAKVLIRSFKAKQGIYGVPGNTDHIVMDGPTLARDLGPAGIDILVNEHRLIQLVNGNQLWLVGFDDPKYHHENMDRALGGVPRQAPKIALIHDPNMFDRFYDEPALILAGDTHGGQVGIPLLIKLSTYASRVRYVKGLFKKQHVQMYVNRGIGTKTLPIRFLCRPEITVIQVTS